jgi:hypothetical protein
MQELDGMETLVNYSSLHLEYEPSLWRQISFSCIEVFLITYEVDSPNVQLRNQEVNLSKPYLIISSKKAV